DEAARGGGAALQERHIGVARQLLEIREGQRAGELGGAARIELDLHLAIVELDVRGLVLGAPEHARDRAGLLRRIFRRGAIRLERQRRDIAQRGLGQARGRGLRSEEHTSELQSLAYLVCRLLLEKKKKKKKQPSTIHTKT